MQLRYVTYVFKVQDRASHWTAVAVLAAVTFLLDNLRHKRSVSLTEHQLLRVLKVVAALG